MAVVSHRSEEIQHVPCRSEQLLSAERRYLAPVIGIKIHTRAETDSGLVSPAARSARRLVHEKSARCGRSSLDNTAPKQRSPKKKRKPKNWKKRLAASNGELQNYTYLIAYTTG